MTIYVVYKMYYDDLEILAAYTEEDMAALFCREFNLNSVKHGGYMAEFVSIPLFEST